MLSALLGARAKHWSCNCLTEATNLKEGSPFKGAVTVEIWSPITNPFCSFLIWFAPMLRFSADWVLQQLAGTGFPKRPGESPDGDSILLPLRRSNMNPFMLKSNSLSVGAQIGALRKHCAANRLLDRISVDSANSCLTWMRPYLQNNDKF